MTGNLCGEQINLWADREEELCADCRHSLRIHLHYEACPAPVFNPATKQVLACRCRRSTKAPHERRRRK